MKQFVEVVQRRFIEIVALLRLRQGGIDLERRFELCRHR
jgi:hypothetical protein